jgi:hypothetical protein
MNQRRRAGLSGSPFQMKEMDMIKELLDIKENDSLDELRARLADAIGWREPVPAAALLRAVSEPAYAAALITSRNMPGFLEPLLNDPRNARYAPPPATATGAKLSNVELLSRAAGAMLRWGKAGFTVAGSDVIARRETACLSCDHLRDPDRLLQQLLPSAPITDEIGRRTGNKVCDLCGCSIAKKIRLPAEACPGAHPTMAGMSRWLEPRSEDAAQPA